MVKRRRINSDSGEDNNSDGSTYSEPAAPERKRAAGRASKSSTSRIKHKTVRKALATATTLTEGSKPLTPHPASRHALVSPEDIQVALLRWFSGVRDSRGMPWRKKYNPNLTLEERSQRAYEVLLALILTGSSLTYFCSI
jgi:A/G-specific adenine glycosylase